MQFKFNAPTYAGYPVPEAQIATCFQNESAADSSTYDGLGECGAILDCVFNNISNRYMAFYAAGATILGFIPTILSMVGTSRGDHLKIHKRFPILALLLSCCNPSTIIAGLAWRTDTPPEDALLKNHVQMEAHGFAAIIHIAAMGAAGLVIWQAVILGMRGVVSFACPTWVNPLIWVLMGPMAHIFDVLIGRCCIEGRNRWSWNLNAIHGIKLRWPWVMRLKDMFLTIFALAGYVYGTVILSSMQLVAPRPALEISVTFAIPAIFARLVALYMLEPENDKGSKGGARDRLLGPPGLNSADEGERNIIRLENLKT
ncbi:hypothetical protein DFH07DRAFT_959876 [Mycena maculata]|uniref:Uncharacterized protein n=1 Tax=Mycena maculata TaxID=230809 RepID=A0AAD7NBS3_9AGAR|nr:hypothetical protein DFH07DRAFT_959876 [Mycena maculata]